MTVLHYLNKARLRCGSFCFQRWLIVCVLITMLGSSLVFGQDDPPLPQITSEDSVNLTIQTLLYQHTADIIEMGFSPNGSTFYTGGLDRQFCVWNVNEQRDAAGALLFCKDNYVPGVSSFDWSLDEKRFVITRFDGVTIDIHRIYRSVEAEQWTDTIDITIQHDAAAPILSLYALQNTLLVFDVFDVYTLYDMKTGDIIATYDGIENTITANHETFALLTLDNEVLVIDARNGEILYTINEAGIDHIQFSANGDFIATWGDTTRIWQLNTDTIENIVLDTTVIDMAYFAPHDQYFVTWEDENIHLWNIESGEIIGTLGEQTGGVQDVQFTSDLTRAITIDSTGIGRIWDIAEDGSTERRLLLRDRVDRAYLSPDNTSMICRAYRIFCTIL